MNTLPPLRRLKGGEFSTLRIDLPLSEYGLVDLPLIVPLISTGPKLVTVMAAVLRGSTGTSPVPAMLVTWIVPAGAEREAPAAAIGPPTGWPSQIA